MLVTRPGFCPLDLTLPTPGQALQQDEVRPLTRNLSFTSRSSASSSNSFWGYTSMPLDSRSAVICGQGQAGRR